MTNEDKHQSRMQRCMKETFTISDMLPVLCAIVEEPGQPLKHYTDQDSNGRTRFQAIHKLRDMGFVTIDDRARKHNTKYVHPTTKAETLYIGLWDATHDIDLKKLLLSKDELGYVPSMMWPQHTPYRLSNTNEIGIRRLLNDNGTPIIEIRDIWADGPTAVTMTYGHKQGDGQVAVIPINRFDTDDPVTKNVLKEILTKAREEYLVNVSSEYDEILNDLE